MLSEIEPEKIICYSEPFSEMKGDIIYVNYELSSWKYLNDIKVNSLTRQNKSDIIIKKYVMFAKAAEVHMVVSGNQKMKILQDF